MARSLVILLHGVGQTPADMAPLAAHIAVLHPDARIAAPPAADPFDGGTDGFQWFSVDGITEENRPARIKAALPAFIGTIRSLQRAHDTDPEHTLLIGFSQGAIMALAACRDTWLARRVVAIAGRCAPLPLRWEARTAVRLVHGTMDGTVPADHSRRAAARLARLGADVQLQLVPRGVHMLSPAMLNAAVDATGLASN
jgi:phospholipase/carboxylesterase